MSASAPPPDDLARGELHTDIGKRTAWVTTAVFVAAVVAIPVMQTVTDVARSGKATALNVFTRVPTKDNLHKYEKEVAEESAAKKLVQPQLQLFLSRCSFGNTNAVVGRDGWLFYRPGVAFLTGPALLDTARLRQRTKELSAAGEKVPSPDPRPAIVAFHESCRSAGVHLVVLPIPDKAVVQPGELTSRLAITKPRPVPTNPDHARLLNELRSAGVDVFDPTPPTLNPGEQPRFLRQDTHWTPQWMETVARDLAEHVKFRVTFPAGSGRTFTVRPETVRRVGDIVDMLQLPTGQTLFPPETVRVNRVQVNGADWQPNADADVLLLGDSFSNIFTASDMGWGQAAGLPAQMARFLGRDVDVIARNGAGATNTRRELARRPNPLGGKRVVVWQFAVRELAQANWDVIPLPPSTHAPPSSTDTGTTEVQLDATVVAVSRVPEPYSVPYKDCLTYIKVRVDRVTAGVYPQGEMLAVFWGMKDNAHLPPAGYTAGKRLRLKVVALRQAGLELGSVRSADDLDDYTHRPFFVVEERAP